VESPAALRDSELKLARPHSETSPSFNIRPLSLLFLITAAAILVHGYHPFVEDAEIYVPGIKKLLNPALYSYNAAFFASHARRTFFPNLILWSARVTPFSLEWVLLLWHFACILCLTSACWQLGRICFGTTRAAWGSAALVASLLTIPVAGTALYIMDQYLNPRSFSTAAVVWILLAVIRRKFISAALICLVTALIHPLMAVFSVFFAVVLLGYDLWSSAANYKPALAILPVALFPPVTSAYRQVLDSHSYFFLLRWQWYEWLGIIGPLIIFWLLGRMALGKQLLKLNSLCASTVIFGALFFAVALAITVPPQFARLAELQPMRSLQLIYILLFAISGGALAEYLLKAKIWRWLVLFIPLSVGMFYAQRQLFPATQHLELPGRDSRNPWVQTFIWIKNNTPVNAYFALDPDHMRLSAEDQHGFRAIAERSMLADRVKDSGAVSMFPGLAQSWLEQVSDENGWSRFDAEDFRRLQLKYGIDWIVVRQPGVRGLDCPFHNSTLAVCRVGEATSEAVNTVK
jgi:uncharacterized membrane protein YvlD (DUF360 family)